MTKEQYKQRRDELEAQIKELEQQYIDACPYKVGDKVEVNISHFGMSSQHKSKPYYISHIDISENEYDFHYVEVNKDGTRSKHGAVNVVWRNKLSDIIRKID